MALRIGVLLRGDKGLTGGIPSTDIAVLNEAKQKTDANYYYQVFSQTLTLRNMKNFVRSAK